MTDFFTPENETEDKRSSSRDGWLYVFLGIMIFVLGAIAIYMSGYAKILKMRYSLPDREKIPTQTTTKPTAIAPVPAPLLLDTVAYDEKMLLLANNPPPPIPKTVPAATSTSKTTTSTTAVTKPEAPAIPNLWPVKTVYPNAGALLPFNRIVAYYGNFYSTKMGILGEYPTDILISKLNDTIKEWEAADPSTPVIPAIDYIAVTAQGSAGFDGKYRARMPDDQIEKAISLADQVHGIVILDVQVGLSTVQTEIPLLEKYLKLPEVHLALDPEFSMKTGARPGTVIGTMDAADINFAANYLATLVKQNNLTPKILIVHRFTENMVTNYQKITPLPEVQIVMDMDGWGEQAHKIAAYKEVIYVNPVQFTGFKLFFKNDLIKPNSRMLTPVEILKLNPEPSFIQYQ